MAAQKQPAICLSVALRCNLEHIVSQNLLCRYVLTYTVRDTLGQSAVQLQLSIVVYESASLQASLQLISQISFTGAAARAQAHTVTASLADASGSMANTAFRSKTSFGKLCMCELDACMHCMCFAAHAAGSLMLLCMIRQICACACCFALLPLHACISQLADQQGHLQPCR